MKKVINLISLALLVAIISSCGKDKENPTIVLNSPAMHSHHTNGTNISMDATLEDDKELASYHMHIGDVDGNHDMAFPWEESGNIDGKSFTLTSSTTIPNGLSGMYYIHIMVTDAEGKTTESSTMIHVD